MFRLATFNVLHGRSLADGKVDTFRLAGACARLGADVLCLQEVDRFQARSGSEDQVAAVAAAMDAEHWRFVPALVGEPGGSWRAAVDEDEPRPDAEPPEPGYGVGLVSRLPVRAWHTLRLAPAPVRAPVAVPGGRGRFLLLPDEPRVALAAEVEAGGRTLLVATTHLSFVPGWNLRQVRLLCRRLPLLVEGADAFLLAGDLNVPGPLPALASGWRPLARARTFPAARPAMQIDHVLASGPRPPQAKAVSARALPLSDHLALVVDLAGAE